MIEKMTEDDTVLVKLIGGPSDGKIIQLKKPLRMSLKMKSPLRSDVYYRYVFDDDENNNEFPLAYIFAEYVKK